MYNFFDQIFLAGVAVFLDDKRKKSLDYAKALSASGRYEFAQLPTYPAPTSGFNSRLAFINSVAQFISSNFRYVPDPDLFDHYTHPGVAYGLAKKCWAEIKEKEAARKSAFSGQEIKDYFVSYFKNNGACFDCDDYSAMACALFMLHAYPLRFEMANLLVADQFKHIRWNHVIFLAQLDEKRWAIIDTNGLNWIEASTRAELEAKTKQFFTVIYKDDNSINIEYKHLISIEYPF